MFDVTELQAVFRVEGQELLEQLLTEFDSLARASTAEAREQVLKAARRTLHTIKGSASSAGMREIAEVGHIIEDLVKTPELVAETSTGALATVVEALEQMRLVLQEKSPATSLEGHLQALRALSPAAAPPPAAAPAEGQSAKTSEPTTSGAEGNGGVVETATSDPATRSATTIRVEVERLDNALAMSTELITGSARMKTASATLQGFLRGLVAAADEQGSEASWLAPLLAQARTIAREDQRQTGEMQRLVADLGDAMKAIRMVPLYRLEGTWRGIVREAALACGKKVQLTIETGDIEIDRDILEALQAPMMHILRNAVDHGIETPAERQERHKPEGRIVITATIKGTLVEMEISDDGRGLDYERIRGRAVEHGLLDAEQARNMDAASLAQFIFASGFSTSEQVSSLSGRGVGLEVARSTVEALGGTVTLRPDPPLGGTTFTLTLPASRVSTAGLFVRSGRTECAVPLTAITRVVRLRREHIQELGGQALIRLDDLGPVRLVDLARVLGQGSAKLAAYVVVIVRDGHRVGLMVDEVLGEDVFVSTSLPWNVGSVAGIAGAIRRADGSLALAVDVAQLYSLAERGPAVSAAPAPAVATTRRVLVVDDSMSIRVFEENLLHEAGYDVTVAVDGEQAWGLLAQQGFDLVISDVEMPALDGLELTRRIRANQALQDLPVVLVSSHAQPEDRAAGAAAGADDYLVKGTFESQDLLATVKRFLGGSAA